jgi:purine nucleosidase
LHAAGTLFILTSLKSQITKSPNPKSQMPSRPLLTPNACLLMLLVGSAAAMAEKPVRISFDTDIAGDVDDVGALAMAHVLADHGEVELVACMISSNNPHSAGCLDALNTWYGRPDIPIGTASRFGQLDGVPDDAVVESKYTRQIAEEFPHNIKEQGTVPATELYRKLLAAEEEKVTIVTVGFLGNIADLLESPGDEVSPLTGRELVEQKVEQWVCMGGIFPAGKFPGGEGEYNVKFGVEGAKVAVEKWPGRIVFSGFEIGQPIGTGEGLVKLPEKNPVRRGFELYNGLTNNSSWDQTAVQLSRRFNGSGGMDQRPRGTTPLPGKEDAAREDRRADRRDDDDPTGREALVGIVANVLGDFGQIVFLKLLNHLLELFDPAGFGIGEVFCFGGIVSEIKE